MQAQAPPVCGSGNERRRAAHMTWCSTLQSGLVAAALREVTRARNSRADLQFPSVGANCTSTRFSCLSCMAAAPPRLGAAAAPPRSLWRCCSPGTALWGAGRLRSARLQRVGEAMAGGGGSRQRGALQARWVVLRAIEQGKRGANAQVGSWACFARCRNLLARCSGSVTLSPPPRSSTKLRAQVLAGAAAAAAVPRAHSHHRPLSSARHRATHHRPG